MARLPSDPESLRMPFAEHLEELRRRVVFSLLALAVLFLAGWTLASDPLVGLFFGPYERAREILATRYDPPVLLPEKLKYLDFLEPVFFRLKVALVGAAVVGLPVALWQLWLFVAAGLYPRERRAVTGYLPFALLAAAAGAAFGYFFLIPEVLSFLITLADPGRMEPSLVISRYFSIFMMFTVALAVIFQLPLLLLGLSAGGVLDRAVLRRYRKHFILGAFVLAAVFTPPEPYSQVLMALPTVILFEIGVLLVSIRERRARKTQGAA